MKLRDRWNRMGIFWQVYILAVLLFSMSVTLVDGFAEPLVSAMLEHSALHDSFIPVFGTRLQVYEIVLWLVGVAVPALSVSYFVARLVDARLKKMNFAARMMQRGDFSTRIPETGNDADSFNQLTQAFNRMAETLELASRNETRLLADISHELRSPLTRMNVGAALLKKDSSPQEFQEVLRGLENDVNHMSSLVSLLLEQGRARSSEREIHEVINLSSFAEDIVDKFRLLGRGPDKHFDTDIQPGLEVLGSPRRVRMIFENLLNNALFYMPENSTTTVSIHEDKDSAEILVRDHGPGVPEDKLENIFRAFFRADPSRARDSGGVGLGLALVKEAVVTMGGQIQARNVNPGLTIHIRIPCNPPKTAPTR